MTMTIKTKIPPPVITLISGVGMWFVAKSPFGAITSSDYQPILVVFFAAAGIVIAATALSQFRSASTTINPHRLENTTSLVRTGIFAYSRNPMYVGLVLILAAWAVWLGSITNLFVIALFVLSITELQIKPEEGVLEKLFGDDYENYRNSVRRWI